MDGYPRSLHLSPPDWPETYHGKRPGDLEFFVPQGFGLGAPAIMTPYGGPPGESYYGFDQPQIHPMLNAPLTESRAGTLYFDDNTSAEALSAALETMGVYRTQDYVAFAATSGNTRKERYLDQLRLVANGALGSLFGAKDAAAPPAQELDVMAALLGFVAAQKEKWNDSYTFSAKLAGSAGGDADWAKESLAFGFHAENTYWGVYRIWSRPWLVTK